MAFVSQAETRADTIAAVFDEVRYEAAKAVHFSFVFERSFTTFLVMDPEIKARRANFHMAHILDTNGRTDTLLIREWGPMIDTWDCARTYTDEQRTIFRGIQKLAILGMHANNLATLRGLFAL